MDRLLDEQTTERLRAALEAMRRGFAEVEEIIYREKCATLPHLSIEERLATFADLYQMAMTFRSPETDTDALEQRHIAETVAFRKLLARVAAHRRGE
jgi:hypothetical protein